MPTTPPTAQPVTRADVEALMQQAFFPGRPVRSAAYMAGVRAKLRHALQGEPFTCPHEQGSTGFDAFFAGVDEARHIAARSQAGQA